jgi:hypothetical protein
MAFEYYTIRQFINGYFGGDESDKGIPKDKLDEVFTEYVNAAGLYETEEFGKVSYIHYISGRINSIKISIRLQREFVEEFGICYHPELKVFEKFGHKIYWNDKENFLTQLSKIESRELKWISILENEFSQLKKMRESKNKGNVETKTKLTRESFIRTINSLGKVGFKIDNNSTTMEEISIMIKQQTEENKSK